MSRPISLAHLSALQLPPPAFIRLAAGAGFDRVGLRLMGLGNGALEYPLMHDRQAMKDTLSALSETGIGVNDIEFLRITHGMDVPALEPFFAAGAELGARQVITAPYDEDHASLTRTLARISALAGRCGLGAVLEFFPWTTVPDLATALPIAEAAGAGILVDALHFDRSGSSLEQLRQVPPGMLPFAHLCDAPVHPPYTTEDLLFAGREERLPPGEGQIPLEPFLQALPPGIPLGLEVPMTQLTAREGPAAAAQRIMAGVRGLKSL